VKKLRGLLGAERRSKRAAGASINRQAHPTKRERTMNNRGVVVVAGLALATAAAAQTKGRSR